MLALYKTKRYIEPPHGTINIYDTNTDNFWEVELWQSADMQTANCSYRINTVSVEKALAIYNEKVKPEIERKEKLYVASGKFDRQNN